VEELTRVVFAQIDSLKRTGPTPAELQKVREAERRSRETEMRDNAFWISQMMSYTNNGWDLREIPAGGDRTARLTPEAVRDAARRYLDTANYVQVSLLPETTAGNRE
jgi:zinc protease